MQKIIQFQQSQSQIRKSPNSSSLQTGNMKERANVIIDQVLQVKYDVPYFQSFQIQDKDYPQPDQRSNSQKMIQFISSKQHDQKSQYNSTSKQSSQAISGRLQVEVSPQLTDKEQIEMKVQHQLLNEKIHQQYENYVRQNYISHYQQQNQSSQLQSYQPYISPYAQLDQNGNPCQLRFTNKPFPSYAYDQSATTNCYSIQDFQDSASVVKKNYNRSYSHNEKQVYIPSYSQDTRVIDQKSTITNKLYPQSFQVKESDSIVVSFPFITEETQLKIVEVPQIEFRKYLPVAQNMQVKDLEYQNIIEVQQLHVDADTRDQTNNQFETLLKPVQFQIQEDIVQDIETHFQKNQEFDVPLRTNQIIYEKFSSTNLISLEIQDFHYHCNQICVSLMDRQDSETNILPNAATQEQIPQSKSYSSPKHIQQLSSTIFDQINIDRINVPENHGEAEHQFSNNKNDNINVLPISSDIQTNHQMIIQPQHENESQTTPPLLEINDLAKKQEIQEQKLSEDQLSQNMSDLSNMSQQVDGSVLNSIVRFVAENKHNVVVPETQVIMQPQQSDTQLKIATKTEEQQCQISARNQNSQRSLLDSCANNSCVEVIQCVQAEELQLKSVRCQGGSVLNIRPAESAQMAEVNCVAEHQSGDFVQVERLKSCAASAEVVCEQSELIHPSSERQSKEVGVPSVASESCENREVDQPRSERGEGVPINPPAGKPKTSIITKQKISINQCRQIDAENSAESEGKRPEDGCEPRQIGRGSLKTGEEAASMQPRQSQVAAASVCSATKLDIKRISFADSKPAPSSSLQKSRPQTEFSPGKQRVADHASSSNVGALSFSNVQKKSPAGLQKPRFRFADPDLDRIYLDVLESQAY